MRHEFRVPQRLGFPAAHITHRPLCFEVGAFSLCRSDFKQTFGETWNDVSFVWGAALKHSDCLSFVKGETAGVP